MAGPTRKHYLLRMADDAARIIALAGEVERLRERNRVLEDLFATVRRYSTSRPPTTLEFFHAIDAACTARTASAGVGTVSPRDLPENAVPERQTPKA